VQCPYCGGESNVIDSRVSADGVRRRRTCGACKRRFTTYEKVGAPSLKVMKRDQSVEPFDFDKLERVLKRVCRGRPVRDEDVRRISRDIEARLIDTGVKVVRSGEIVDLALDRLREVDRLAYSRLAANYVDEAGRLRTDGMIPTFNDEKQLPLFDGEDE
jgi:transcriptional repressor NrdR